MTTATLLEQEISLQRRFELAQHQLQELQAEEPFTLSPTAPERRSAFTKAQQAVYAAGALLDGSRGEQTQYSQPLRRFEEAVAVAKIAKKFQRRSLRDRALADLRIAYGSHTKSVLEMWQTRR